MPFYQSVFHTGNEKAQDIRRYEKWLNHHKIDEKCRALVSGEYNNRRDFEGNDKI